MRKAKRIDTGKRVVPRPSWRQRFREAPLPLAVCGLSFLVYSRSLFCVFVRDDIPQIVKNPQVQSWDYLPQLLGSHLWSQIRNEPVLFYRPVFSLWMLLIHTFGGLSPWFWHFSSILLHVAVTYLVFRLCRQLTENDVAAMAAAAIFAVHPIHVDAVTWVSASCEVLFTMFALAAMLVLLDSDKDKDKDKAKDANWPVWVSALWFGAGLFAKETGLMMLAILPAIAWVQLHGRVTGRKRIWEAAYPYGLMSAGYLLVRWAVMHRVGVEMGEHSWAEVIFSAPSILLFYLKKLFLPWGLSGCYSNAISGSPTTTFWLQLITVLLGFASIAWFATRRRSLCGLAAALIVAPIIPALAVLRIYPQGDITHDRYLYLPSIGLSLLVALLVAKIASLKTPARVTAIAAVVAVSIVFSAETISLQKYYQNDFAFYTHVIELSPSNALAMGMLGNLYLDENRNDVALEQFRRAHQAAPDNQKVTLFLARGLFLQGKYRDSESVLNELLQNSELNPRRRKSTLVSLANVEISLGNLNYAQQLLQQVEQSDDHFPELHWGLGVLYQREGLLQQALAEYQREFDITGDELAQQRSASVAKLIYAQSAVR